MQETASREARIDEADATRPIRLISATLLEGPNAWSSQPVVHLVVDSGSAAEDGTARLRSQMAASGLALDDGPAGEGALTNIGKYIEAIAFEMQVYAGDEVTFSASRSGRGPGTFDVALGFEEPEMPLATAMLAIRMLNSMLFDETSFDFGHEFDQRVLRLVHERPVRPQEQAIVRAARRRGIPCRSVVPGGTLFELGTGKYLRRYRGMMSSDTAYLGNSISSNKMLTKQLLREIGLPVPEGIVVSSVEEAVDAAARLGYPVVLKPLNAGQGRGLGVDLRTEEKVRAFFPVAAGATRRNQVIVEQFVPGNEYRILVVGGKVAAVAQRLPAHVTGDGLHTVKELIELTNAEPLRGRGHQNILTRITIDTATFDALERQGLTLESVPAEGQHVPVKLASNLSQGGTSHDRTDEIHPENARLACLAAKTIDIAICGVDLITPDISRPVWEVGGAFIEVNYEPGSKIHSHPQHGKPRDTASAIVDAMFPPGQPVRVPIVAVTGSRDAEGVCELIARIVRGSGAVVGVTTTRGSSIDGASMDRPDLRGRPHAQLVLRNPYVDLAVLQVDPVEIDERGLSFDYGDVLVVTRTGERPLNGPRSIETVLLDVIGEGGAAVFDIGDPQIDNLLRQAPERTILISKDPDDSAIRRYLAEGKRIVAAHRDVVTLMSGEASEVLMPTGVLGSAIDGYPIESGLAAIAAALALDTPVETIRGALQPA